MLAEISRIAGMARSRRRIDALRPLRILHVTPYFEQAWAYGGIPRVVAALSAGMVARGHAVTVCTTDVHSATRRLRRPPATPTAGPWQEWTSAGVDVRTFPNRSNRLAYNQQLFIPTGMAAYLKAHTADFDVAHLHACHNLPGVIAARHLHRTGVPYVLTPNGTAPLIERRQFAKWAFDVTVGRHVISGAARLLAVSEAERRQFHALGVADSKIATVPNPLNLVELEVPLERGAFRRAHGFSDAPIVMYLGKLTPRKRLDILAEAFARLNRPDAKLVIAGNDMGYERELRTILGRLGLQDRTTFTGLLTGHERLEALADADVVSYASKDEIFGLVPLEAILCGTPVVVADDSGCGEVITKLGGGLIVREGDGNALAAALSSVLNAPGEWRERARAAQSPIRTLYSASAVCAQLATVYEAVIAERVAR